MNRRYWPTLGHFRWLAKLYLAFGAAAGLAALVIVIAIAHPAWIAAFVFGAVAWAMFESLSQRGGGIGAEIIGNAVGLFSQQGSASFSSGQDQAACSGSSYHDSNNRL